ncbi:MAG: trehalose-phosphatase [Parachlamydiaceae bacterium]|nr:trehalose-phosphatase [Parachlamydiaceae bacterium]
MKELNGNVNLKSFFEKVKQRSLLLLDFDGTLAPFVTERMDAKVYPGIREHFIALLQTGKTRIVIISGRALKDLEKILGDLPQVELWGSHGLERKQVNGNISNIVLNPRLLEGLAKAKDLVKAEDCECKPYSVALHWRGKESKKEELLETIEKKWTEIGKEYDLELHHFDGGLELRPRGYSKGDVVHHLLKEEPSDIAIAYLGDDMTDEDAFKVLGKRGLKVLVREQLRPTLADLHLIPPKELLAFLDRWKGGSNE